MKTIQGNGSLALATHNRQQSRLNMSQNNNNSNSDTNISVEDLNKSDCAVYIRNLCKRYDEGPPIVQNLCMNVRKGTIYGLLGSSGCGKTTILSCIVGLRKWDSGDVLVFGQKPGTKESGIPGKRLGYMPQELALYNQLSIKEVIQFYGRIYNMTGSEVTEKWKVLNKLLELPSKFKLVGQLSGGQMRRASLALALIHSPELLVLDEPTVGLDPLLRCSIWDHLYKIVNTLGTTIIITTHYIEEARLSNTIGVMRKGRLLVEDSPKNLLDSFKCERLEDVVLQLCRLDESKLKFASPKNASRSPKNNLEFRSSWIEKHDSSIVVPKEEHELMIGVFRKNNEFDTEQVIAQKLQENSTNNLGFYGKISNTGLYQSIQRIYGLTMVILLTFIRYPYFLALILCIPSIQGSITLWSTGSKPRNMPLGIVNHELSNWTLECDLPRHSDNSCDFISLSCKYINQVKTDDLLTLVPYISEEEALADVHLGKSWGYLVFPSNYSQHTFDRAAAKYFATEESINGSKIHVYLDYSQSVATFFMVKHILYSYMDYVKQLAENCNIGGQQAETPLMFRKPVYGNNNDDFTPYVMPGVILSSLFGIVSSLTALLFIADRKQGTLSRARVAGLQTVDVMASHLITQAFVTIGQIVIWNLVLHFVFGFVIEGSQWLYLVFLSIAGICGAGIGLLLGTTCHDEVQAMIIGVFLCPIFILFGGVFYPLESMSRFWRHFGYLMPTSLPTQSLRSIVVRGLGLTHILVWPGFLVLFAWILLMLFFSVLAYRRNCK